MNVKQDVLLTIGMPVYNGEKYIRIALESILAQTYMDFILIISDNASTDETASIIADFVKRDPRIIYFRQEQNLGAVANFRFVFDQCKTPFFSWVAADDYWSSDWFEKLMEVATKSHCLSFGVIEAVNQDGKRIRHPANHQRLQFTGGVLFRRLSYFINPGLLGKANPIYGVFRKEDFSELVWKRFSTTDYGPDVAALHVLLEVVPILSRTDVILYKRRHRDNASQVELGSKRHKPPFRKTMLLVFLNQSGLLERLFILLLYPVAATGVIYAKFFYLALRVRSRFEQFWP